MKKIAFFAILMLISASCTSLSRSEKVMVNELRAEGVRFSEEQAKSPAAAGALNLLPGVGNFYLASGTEESSQVTYGVINLLFWPLSIVWGIPQAAIDAGTINKKETIYYYYYDPIGKKELRKIKARNREDDDIDPQDTVAKISS